MKNKKEKFFALLDNMNKPNLYALRMVAKEIDDQLQWGINGEVEIGIMPDSFRCTEELTGEKGAPYNYIKRNEEREKDRRRIIEFLKIIEMIKSYEYKAKEIRIEVDKEIFSSRYLAIKEKYDNFIQHSDNANYEYIDGVLFYKGLFVFHLESEQRKAIFKLLWDNREEVLKKTKREGRRQLTSELTKQVGYKTNDQTKSAIAKFKSMLKNLKDIQISGAEYVGYLMTIKE